MQIYNEQRAIAAWSHATGRQMKIFARSSRRQRLLGPKLMLHGLLSVKGGGFFKGRVGETGRVGIKHNMVTTRSSRLQHLFLLLRLTSGLQQLATRWTFWFSRDRDCAAFTKSSLILFTLVIVEGSNQTSHFKMCANVFLHDLLF